MQVPFECIEFCDLFSYGLYVHCNLLSGSSNALNVDSLTDCIIRIFHSQSISDKNISSFFDILWRW